MARGFLSGVMWGAVFSVGAAAVASLVAGTALRPNLGDAPTVGSAPAASEQPQTGVGVGADADVASGIAAQPPTPDSEAATFGADVTTPSPRPETGEASELAPPPEVPEVAEVTAGTESAAPRQARTVPASPFAPSVGEEPTVSTELAQPQVPAEDTAVADDVPEDDTVPAGNEVSTPAAEEDAGQ